MLVIVNRQDHIVDPTTAIQFQKLAKSKLVLEDSDCGHLAFDCEAVRIAAECRRF